MATKRHSCMGHLLSLQADLGYFLVSKGCCFLLQGRTGIRQRAAPQSQYSPPMIWCEHVPGPDSCAEGKDFS